MSSGKQDQFRLGFLTAIEAAGRGFVGGLLVTNHLGRPLEFQCTAPVKPNRTQEILYGPTLGPYLLGDLIGRTLVEKAAVKPTLVLIERDELLELRNHVALPVARIAADRGPTSTELQPVCLGRQVLRFHERHPADARFVEQHGGQVPRDADLREPFIRVCEALKEILGMPAERAA